MSDSDSDSDYGDCGYIRHRMDITRRHSKKNAAITLIQPSDEVYDRWTRISVEVKKEAAQLLKLCAFWLPILLRHGKLSTTACWAVEIGLIDSNDRENISLKHLHRIETLEAILRALEKGLSLKKDQSKHVIWISNRFNLRSPEVLEDALHWFERTGESSIRSRILELGHPNTCFTALHFIFTEYAQYIREMGNDMEKTMRALQSTTQPPESRIERSEEMKKKGNDSFQKNQYEDAVKFYSKAIKYYPENHKLYGNRALCYIRSKKYLKAVGDGKRATLIKPFWAKGHYRYCEALFSLGEVNMAIEANSSAQNLCKDDQEGIKELEQQHTKFITEMAEAKERTSQAEGIAKVSTKGSTKDSKPSKSEFSSKNGKGDSNPAAKKKSKSRNCPSENDIRLRSCVTAITNNQKVADLDAESDVCRELRSMVQDAHTALTDLRSRNAEQAFSRALALVDTSTSKLNMEDPCIICHKDMSPDDICVLECRHSFHKECIKSWLKEQSTCPTCRDHALLPDDFPVLPGRRRQAP